MTALTDAFSGVQSAIAGLMATTQGLSGQLQIAGISFNGFGAQADNAGTKASAAVGGVQKAWLRATTSITGMVVRIRRAT